MGSLVLADVIMRRALNAPIIFADEVSGYLLVFITFLGLGYTFKEEGHIQVKIIVQLIPPRSRTSLRLIWYLIGTIYTIILLIMTAQLTWESYCLKAFSHTSLLPLFPFQFVMPIGCFLLLPQLLIELIDSFLNIIKTKESNKVL
jgi:TRAP-type C4-dicarboxylate transport system permease small subunit